MVGVGISGWLADNLGWKAVFWMGAVVNFIVVPFWVICVRNSPKEHPWLSPYEEKILLSTKHIKIQVRITLI